MDALFSDLLRSTLNLLPKCFHATTRRGRGAGSSIDEVKLLTSLYETLRSATSVSDGLKHAFEQFCEETRPERGIVMSAGPLVVTSDSEPQLHILHSWPEETSAVESHLGDKRIRMNLCLRAITEVRHQGEIGIFVYFNRHFSARDARMYRRILGSLVLTAAAMIEVDHRYRTLLRALPFDPLTHLPVWSLFREKVERRFPRLDREQLPATLMLVNFSGLVDTPNDIVEGEEAVEQIARVRDAINFLKRAIRPTDLVGQLDRESFIVWLDGGDRFASVERAELICKRRYRCANNDIPQISVKIGLVTREPCSTDTLDVFFERARLALSIANEENVDWHFAHENA